MTVLPVRVYEDSRDNRLPLILVEKNIRHTNLNHAKKRKSHGEVPTLCQALRIREYYI